MSEEKDILQFVDDLKCPSGRFSYTHRRRCDTLLYLSPYCTDFSANGLGVLTPQSCAGTETLNGEYELTLEHPLDSDGKWMKLREDCILRAPVPTACTPRIYLCGKQDQSDTVSDAATDSVSVHHSYKGDVGHVADNVVNRDFSTTVPFEKWTTNVSQFSFPWGKCYSRSRI